MIVTDTLEPEELARILKASELWDDPEEIGEAVDSREGFVVITRNGKNIDSAIGDYYIDDGDVAGEVPARWVVYIDAEALGRDIRLSGEDGGRAVDLISDPSGMYGQDWRYYIIRNT